MSQTPADKVCNRCRMSLNFSSGCDECRGCGAPLPSDVEKLNNYAAELCNKVGVGVDAGLLEELISLFNAKILTAYVRPMRSEFNKDNCKLTVSQCYRVAFEGKERIAALESENKRLNNEKTKDWFRLNAQKDACIAELEAKLASAEEELKKFREMA